MTSTEKDRLDLRQEFERLFNNKRIAEIAMEALPPIDYAQLATKRDLDSVRAEMLGEFGRIEGNFAKLEAKVDGGFAELRGEMHKLNASNLRTTVAGQITTMMLLGGWVTAVT